MSHPPDASCPCGSEQPYARCCGPAHAGTPAPTPEALMRSRYAAYALGLTEYLIHTTHREGPHWQDDQLSWAAEIDAFCRATRFEGLTIEDARAVEDGAIVVFRATLRGPSGATTMRERSVFQRVGGRWLYHSGRQG